MVKKKTKNDYSYLLDEAKKSLEANIKLGWQLNENLPKKDGLAVAYSLLLNNILESSQSLIILSHYKKLGDCYSISRSILDNALNIGYFSIKGEEAVNKAYNHYLQKSFRDLKRDINIKDIRL